MTPDVDEAVRVLEAGGLVVYPTDTLFGLGARIGDPTAVARVFDVKRRPRGQPLSVAVATVDDLERYAHVTPLAKRLYGLLPGPLTIVLEKRSTVPDVVTGGRSDVGLRIPDHPVALELLRRVGPLTCTSANLHGHDDPASLAGAQMELGDRVDYYVPSPTPLLGAASTLVDARGVTPRVLRAGAVVADQIRRCIAY